MMDERCGVRETDIRLSYAIIIIIITIIIMERVFKRPSLLKYVYFTSRVVSTRVLRVVIMNVRTVTFLLPCLTLSRPIWGPRR